MKRMLSQFRAWICAKTLPWVAPYWKAKKLHESSPHGLFYQNFYHLLTKEDIQQAASCIVLAEAIQLYQECILSEEEAGRHFNVGIAMQQLATVFHRQGKLYRARDLYLQAIDMLEDLPAVEAIAAISTCCFRLTEIYLAMREEEKARKYHERGYRIDQRLGDVGGTAAYRQLQEKLEEEFRRNEDPS